MTIKVKKTAEKARPSNEPDDMVEEDKLEYMLQEYKLAVRSTPDYEEEKKEIRGYSVELPTKPDFKDLSKINRLYAMAQSFSSRITTLEVQAIDNQSRWKRLANFMEEYIEDKQCRLLTKKKYSEMTNMRAEAAVRTALHKEYSTFRNFKDKEAEAYSFMMMIQAKKKDLTSILTTLGKQVHALSLEAQSVSRL